MEVELATPRRAVASARYAWQWIRISLSAPAFRALPGRRTRSGGAGGSGVSSAKGDLRRSA